MAPLACLIWTFGTLTLFSWLNGRASSLASASKKRMIGSFSMRKFAALSRCASTAIQSAEKWRTMTFAVTVTNLGSSATESGFFSAGTTGSATSEAGSAHEFQLLAETRLEPPYRFRERGSLPLLTGGGWKADVRLLAYFRPYLSFVSNDAS